MHRVSRATPPPRIHACATNTKTLRAHSHPKKKGAPPRHARRAYICNRHAMYWIYYVMATYTRCSVCLLADPQKAVSVSGRQLRGESAPETRLMRSVRKSEWTAEPRTVLYQSVHRHTYIHMYICVAPPHVPRVPASHCKTVQAEAPPKSTTYPYKARAQ